MNKPDSVKKPGAPPEVSQSAKEAESFVSTLGAFWAQLKKHKVVQWTLAYLAIVFTLLHGAEMLVNTLDWPHGLLRIFTLILILGIPVVVTLAWYHGARGQQQVSGTELMVIAILLALGGAFLWRDSRVPHDTEIPASVAQQHAGAEVHGPVPDAASVAVLAFSDLSAGHDQEYFSDGIAEEILNVLAHVEGLKVASRVSSFQFRNSDLGIPAIAQKLGVRHVLEGSVRKSGDMVRITAQLIDATTDQHLWSETFDRPLSTANLFAIQDEIAATIVGKLTASIAGTAKVIGAPGVKATTEDMAAYDLYLKGRALFLARSPEKMVEATRLLKSAVAKDPDFARAWEQLAAVFVVSEWWGLAEEEDYQQAALDAAHKALRLEPDLSLAYAVRAEAQFNMLLRDGKGGKAVWDESFNSYGEALKRDPLNATAFEWRGSRWFSLGFLDRAADDFRNCLVIEPSYELCRRFLAQAYLTSGRTEEALRAYETGRANGDVNSDSLFARAALERGDRAGALAMISLQFQARPQLIGPLQRALTDPDFSEGDRRDVVKLVDLKDESDLTTSALWLLKAYEPLITVGTDTPIVLWLRDDPDWLRSSARKRMMAHWRLPEYWNTHDYPPQCHAVGAADFECS